MTRSRRPRRSRLLTSMLGASLLVALAAAPAAAVNDRAVMVLHALPDGGGVSCNAPEITSFDCSSAATVSVGGGEAIAVFLLVHDFDELVGLQCRFTWPASWIFQGWQDGCGGNQIVIQASPGAESWELATVFDAITRSFASAPIGWLRIVTGGAGCLSIAESTRPFGTHVVALSGSATTPVPEARRGSICTGQPGIDGCGLGAQLRHSSWGAIKAGFDP